MRRLTLSLLGLALITGCGDDDGGATASESSLTGIAWQVGSGLTTSGWERVAPSATFAKGKVSGSTGCNRFTASYEINGEQLQLGRVAATRKACDAPADAVETEYLRALDAVGTWRLDGDELVLGDNHGKALLRLREASPAGVWVATAILQRDAVASPLPGTKLTAEFAIDGTLTGSAGCNAYRAQYTRARRTLRITPPTRATEHCTNPAGIMDQENAYLTSLPLTRSYQLDGETLTLLTTKGTIVATYTRSG
jgi:heat shock protein HslJ